MREVVVTGLGLVTPAGVGREAFQAGLAAGQPLGREMDPREGAAIRRPFRFADVSGFDPAAFLPRKAMRRMSSEGQMVTSSVLLAWQDAGADHAQAGPDSTGTYLGSGFGSLKTTVSYLEGLFDDGMDLVSPLLFSESLANSPLGHAAIRLQAQGPSMAFSGGDGSIVTALAEARRAIGIGRLSRAVCCGFDLVNRELWSVLSRLAARQDHTPFFSNGAVTLFLEEAGLAAGRGATVLARVAGVGQAGDPSARRTAWSEDPEAWSQAFRSAVRSTGEALPEPGAFVRHAPPSEEAARCELETLREIFPGWREYPEVPVHRTFGSYGASGGFTLAAAVLECATSRSAVAVGSGSWGGATGAALLMPA